MCPPTHVWSASQRFSVKSLQAQTYYQLPINKSCKNIACWIYKIFTDRWIKAADWRREEDFHLEEGLVVWEWGHHGGKSRGGQNHDWPCGALALWPPAASTELVTRPEVQEAQEQESAPETWIAEGPMKDSYWLPGFPQLPPATQGQRRWKAQAEVQFRWWYKHVAAQGLFADHEAPGDLDPLKGFAGCWMRPICEYL